MVGCDERRETVSRRRGGRDALRVGGLLNVFFLALCRCMDYVGQSGQSTAPKGGRAEADWMRSPNLGD